MPKIKHRHSWGKKMKGTYSGLSVTTQFCGEIKCNGALVTPEKGGKFIGQKGRFFPGR